MQARNHRTIALAISSALILVAGSCSREPTTPSLSSPKLPTLSILHGEHAIVLNLGATLQLPVSLLDSAGNALAMPFGLTVVSRDTTIVAIESGNTVRAHGLGTTEVVATLSTGEVTLSDSLTADVTCTAELGVAFTPPSLSIAVGGSFTPSVQLTTCGGQLHPTDVITWDSADPAIVRVDSLSGAATALAVGHTALRAHGARYGALGGIPVTVVVTP